MRTATPTSVSHTSHPVGWEEFSTIPQRYIDTAVGLLQQAYQFAPTTRGSDMTQYLISAPVLMPATRSKRGRANSGSETEPQPLKKPAPSAL